MLFVPKMTSIGNTCSNLELHTNLVGKSRRLWLCLFSLSREMFLLQFLNVHNPQAVSIISTKKTIMIPGRWVFPSIWTNRCPEAEADDRRGAIILGGCLKIQPFDTFHTYAVLCLWYHNIPFYAIPYHAILYHTVPNQTIPYHTTGCNNPGGGTEMLENTTLWYWNWIPGDPTTEQIFSTFSQVTICSDLNL